VRLVLAKPGAGEAWLDAPAYETYGGLRGQLEVCWLPADDFTPPARQRLCFALERWAEDSARWLCVDIGGAGVVGSLVAASSRQPCAIVVTAADVFGRLLLYPDEVAAALARSQLLACANPTLLQPLEVFCPDQLGALAAARCVYVVRPTAGALAAPDRVAGDYVCTTGKLGMLDDLSELLDRIVAALRDSGATRWRHVGVVEPPALGRLLSLAALRGLADVFEATGVCSSQDYAAAVCGARLLLKPRGEVDTGLSVAEAQASGVRVSLPHDATPARATADGASLDCAAFARRLLAL
jgi:hypothetical protein